MPEARSPALQEFLAALGAAFAARDLEPGTAAFVARLHSALARSVAQATDAPVPQRRDVCGHLPAALKVAASASPHLARLAAALAALEPSLAWLPRPSGGPKASANWPDGHANTIIIGPAHALETRTDVWVGASLMAPTVRYPDHTHPPEEVYVVLTPGRFQHGDADWVEPGPGGTFHNVPGITHAMAATDTPFLAIWCLLPD